MSFGPPAMHDVQTLLKKSLMAHTIALLSGQLRYICHFLSPSLSANTNVLCIDST